MNSNLDTHEITYDDNIVDVSDDDMDKDREEYGVDSSHKKHDDDCDGEDSEVENGDEVKEKYEDETEDDDDKDNNKSMIIYHNHPPANQWLELNCFNLFIVTVCSIINIMMTSLIISKLYS